MTDSPKNRITSFVTEHLAMLDYEGMVGLDRQRFSVSLDSLLNYRLEALLKKIGMKKTQFIESAIGLLVEEFELQLGLNNEEYYKKLYSSYDERER